MNGDGSDVRRLTNMPGPDGGPFFSADGSKIVFRGRHPGPGNELADYYSLLKQAIWRPTSLELFVMNRDGSGLRQVTKLGGANFAGADMAGADLSDADLSGANFASARGLTADQVGRACGDRRTRLPRRMRVDECD